VNKTTREFPVTFRLEEPAAGNINLVSGSALTAKKQGITEGEFFIVLDSISAPVHKNKIKIGVYDGDKRIELVKTIFMGPRKYK